MIADLHCHSRVSDGSLGIDEIVFFAKRAGLSYLALTDHDTMVGVTRASVIGKRFGLEIIPGVEISALDSESGQKVHVLCYMPERPERLEGILRQTLESRNAAGQQMIQRAMRFYPITSEHVMKYCAGSQALYKCHIMHAICDIGYDKAIYGEVYRELFGANGNCRVAVNYPTLTEVLNAVKLARGIAAIAHPVSPDMVAVCERLAKEGGIHAIECWHPRVKKAEREELLGLCKEYSLVATGGSDFHGMFSPDPNPMGSCMTPQESVSQLFSIKKKIQNG